MTETVAENSVATTTGTSHPDVVTGTTTGGNVTVTTPTVQGTNWEQAYKGLQATVNKLKTENDRLTAEVQRLSTESETLKVDKDALARQLAENGIALETAKKDAAKSKMGLSRKEMILSKFPELASWESQGLLPAADDEEGMETAFTNFRDTLTKQMGAQTVQQMKGASPSSGTVSLSEPSQGDDEDTVWRMLNQYAGRDDAKFKEWQARWDAIQLKKMKKQG